VEGDILERDADGLGKGNAGFISDVLLRMISTGSPKEVVCSTLKSKLSDVEGDVLGGYSDGLDEGDAGVDAEGDPESEVDELCDGDDEENIDGDADRINRRFSFEESSRSVRFELLILHLFKKRGIYETM